MYLANTGSDHAKCIRLSCTFSDLATAIKKQILLYVPISDFKRKLQKYLLHDN